MSLVHYHLKIKSFFLIVKWFTRVLNRIKTKCLPIAIIHSHFFQSRQLEKLNHKMVARNKIWVQNEKKKKINYTLLNTKRCHLLLRSLAYTFKKNEVTYNIISKFNLLVSRLTKPLAGSENPLLSTPGNSS